MSKQLIVQGLAQVCEKAYALEASSYPEFMQNAWADQVTVARAIVGQSASAYDTALATGFSEQSGETVPEWAAAMLEKNHTFVAARIQLAAVYEQASQAILAASDEALIPTLQGLEAHAVAAAKAVGSTPDRDVVLTTLVKDWVEKSIASLTAEEEIRVEEEDEEI